MDIDPNNFPQRDLYKLFTATVVPRPIAWVSTVNAAGQPNLAPFSFFNAVCSDPPTLLFCPSIRAADLAPKDTYHNIRATGEFVVNVVTDETVQQMNLTSTELPAEVDEFALAKLTPLPSKRVKAPYVAESPVHFECKLREIVTIGEGDGGGYIVIGTVIYLHIDDRVLRDGKYIDYTAFHPVGRLTGSLYAHVHDLFEVKRPPSQIKGKNS